jgi:hypothetical protein
LLQYVFNVFINNTEHIVTLSMKSAVVIALSIALVACGSIPKQALQADAKQKIKTIAVMQAPEPDRYFLNPGQLPGGAALYAFGALGGLLLGGIEATRAENATAEFNTAMVAQTPAVGALWNDELFRSVTDRGYSVVKIAPLVKTSNGKELDCTNILGKYDAVLVTSISAGYSVESQVEPRVIANAKLLNGDCKQSLYSEAFIYGASQIGSHTFVERNAEFAFPSREALLANMEKSKEALRTGTVELAKRVAQEL